ncbi:class I SAM-dependent methyltransferase [Clostridium tarantellae]|uniref:Methyltransferase n=1 Tax=Clostridium tarantellae TaxID=39493 RepID=A0A6I1MPT5_9CLOT|nr:methyltransferase [Clostridium tarantellae]MPQ44823.1 methyltransferase [Clostridium tarantellae]
MTEQQYEKLLNIKTSGEQKIFNKSLHYNRYEPTSYFVLETLFKEYEVNEDDYIIDFGCGKGRLNFYLNYFFNANVTGIEMNTYFFEEAISNKNNYLKFYKKNTNNIKFLNCFAEKYDVNFKDNKFYFFNPFSLQIFIKVISNILISMAKSSRNIDIILYYPSEDYIYYLENNTAFTLKKEIKIPSLYENNINEKILIYTLSYN